jgi:hypothetical protein
MESDGLFIDRLVLNSQVVQDVLDLCQNKNCAFADLRLEDTRWLIEASVKELLDSRYGCFVTSESFWLAVSTAVLHLWERAGIHSGRLLRVPFVISFKLTP